MRVTVDVSKDLKRVKKELNRLQKSQVPFATSNTLNDLAFKARSDTEVKAMRKYMDRPVRFTLTSLRVRKSNKKTLHAQVYVDPKRYEYIKYLVKGGNSRRGGKGHAIPVDKSVMNKYGGLPRNKVKSLLRKKGHFIAESKGQAYVWKRTTKKSNPIEPLILFKDSTQHRVRYPIWRMSRAMINRDFEKTFHNNLKRAMRTAR